MSTIEVEEANREEELLVTGQVAAPARNRFGKPVATVALLCTWAATVVFLPKVYQVASPTESKAATLPNRRQAASPTESSNRRRMRGGNRDISLVEEKKENIAQLWLDARPSVDSLQHCSGKNMWTCDHPGKAVNGLDHDDFVEKLTEIKTWSSKSKSWSGNVNKTYSKVKWPGWKGHFDDNALFEWGNASSDYLYVWSVGTHSMCNQYAETLYHVSQLGYYVLCPEISHDFSIVEWAGKSVAATRWAVARKSKSRGKFYKKIVTGGHSGGGPVALGSGYYLQKAYDIKVDAFALQHPGAVPNLNVPGCKYLDEKHPSGDDYVWCNKFFPKDLFDTVKGTVLVTCGNFCEWSEAKNSNWFGAYKSRSPWLKNPSDCMIDTACDLVHATFIKPAASGILFSHCGEHEFSVVGLQGFESEGSPVVLPFMESVMAGTSAPLEKILALDGKKSTCKMERCGGDGCLTNIHEASAAMVASVFPKHFATKEVSGNISVEHHVKHHGGLVTEAQVKKQQ